MAEKLKGPVARIAEKGKIFPLPLGEEPHSRRPLSACEKAKEIASAFGVKPTKNVITYIMNANAHGKRVDAAQLILCSAGHHATRRQREFVDRALKEGVKPSSVFTEFAKYNPTPNREKQERNERAYGVMRKLGIPLRGHWSGERGLVGAINVALDSGAYKEGELPSLEVLKGISHELHAGRGVSPEGVKLLKLHLPVRPDYEEAVKGFTGKGEEPTAEKILEKIRLARYRRRKHIPRKGPKN